VLDKLDLDPTARVLDLGCGRGAVLTMAAGRLGDGGLAVGVDLWRAVDQSGNTGAAARANAATEGVAERVRIVTADMRRLPFGEGFDAIVSSLAIHNIHDPNGRADSIREAARVLRPGGRIAIADFRHCQTYAEQLRGLGLADVAVCKLGWRFWYGGPWGVTWLLTATKP
jgi:arsenite methyltransferase